VAAVQVDFRRREMPDFACTEKQSIGGPVALAHREGSRECAVPLQISVKLSSTASDSPLVDEPTWVFERKNQYLQLRRSETADGNLLVVVGEGVPRSYRFDELTALVDFQNDMESLLLKTGWSFVAFSPERRTGKDRRTWPRLTERRRWWTDGQLWRLLGVRGAPKDR
jgi:hypothetical protein